MTNIIGTCRRLGQIGKKMLSSVPSGSAFFFCSSK
jgi:hypothetical protein